MCGLNVSHLFSLFFINLLFFPACILNSERKKGMRDVEDQGREKE